MELGPSKVKDDFYDLSNVPSLKEPQDPLQFFSWEHAWGEPFSSRLFEWLGERTIGQRTKREWFVSLRDQDAHLREEIEVLARSSAASAFRWLQEMCEAMNPLPGTQQHMMVRNSIGCLSAIQRAVFAKGTLRKQDIRSLRTVHQLALDAISSVQQELDFQLGQRETLTFALQRYASRSRWYHASRLRTIAIAAGEKKRSAEVELSRDACSYLFDLGFDAVWRELAVGSSRYDIVGTFGKERLLVESKVLRDRSRSADVINAANQLRQYASHHLSEGSLVQPVLLLYRVGGPTWQVAPIVPHELLPLTIQYVDIGASKDSGSRVAGSIDLTSQELAFNNAQPSRRPPKKPRKRQS